MSEWQYEKRVCATCKQEFLGVRPLCHECERKNSQHSLLIEIDEYWNLVGLKIAELLTGNEAEIGEQEIHWRSLKLFTDLEKKFKVLHKYLKKVCEQ